MRLWSIHPEYLDAKGIVALWREALLAQKVLQGTTKGYKNHPQLIRFKKCPKPVEAVAEYLSAVADEADRRNYNFDRSKVAAHKTAAKIPVTSGQLEYEFQHLLRKLEKRDPERCRQIQSVDIIVPHPKFRVIPGGLEAWEIT